MKRNKAFTLIELVSVLVILAILALIVTPLVLNIIRKARTAADKRSIDAYGRSIELAVADCLLDNGTFPTSIDELTIEYNGDRVECSTTQLNSDSSVYLSECTVNSRAVEGYTYGKEVSRQETYRAYSVGDIIEYNNINYYVIKGSDESESTVTILKAEPLTVEEVNTYGGVGTENNHVNMYVTADNSSSYYRQSYNQNGYGGIAYYTSETCGYVNGENIKTSCTNLYAQSEIKYIVDAWALDKVQDGLEEARLITYEEINSMVTVETVETPTASIAKYVTQYDWLFCSDYSYWTMSPYQDSLSYIWVVSAAAKMENDGYGGGPHHYQKVVRPVITIKKSALN